MMFSLACPLTAHSSYLGEPAPLSNSCSQSSLVFMPDNDKLTSVTNDSFIDPSLEHELMSSTPWALSPLIATMPHFIHTPIPGSSSHTPSHSHSGSSTSSLSSPADLDSGSDSNSEHASFESSESGHTTSTSSSIHTPSDSTGSQVDVDLTTPDESLEHDCHIPQPPEFPSQTSIGDDISYLKIKQKGSGKASRTTATSAAKLKLSTPSKRRNYFAKVENRKGVSFGPKVSFLPRFPLLILTYCEQDLITTDFSYGFIQFPRLALSLPGGLSFDLTKYWDGQPVRFVCCERAKEGEMGASGRVFWCVAIEQVAEEDVM